MIDVAIAKQARDVFTACGAIKPQSGSLVLPWPPKSFLLPMVLQAGQTATFTLEVTGETGWELAAISSLTGMAVTSSASETIGVRLNIQLPHGRYLFGGNGIDVSQFAWIGSQRYLMSPSEVCQPGEKIQVLLSDFGLGETFAMTLLFEGSYQYPVEGGPIPKSQSALDIPRYQGILNENILAPAWMAGEPKVAGDYFVYSSPSSFDANGNPTGTPIPLAGPIATTLKISIDDTEDFVCRRILLALEADPTVTAGVCLGKIRLGTGYALNDSYIDLAQYVNGVEFSNGWTIQAGDNVFADLALADLAGTGNMYAQLHLEGYKKRRP